MALTCFGLLAVFGFVIDIQQVRIFGEALVIAPLPIPFRDLNGYESFASQREYEIVYKSGDSKIILLEKNHRKFLKGPHRRTIVYRSSLIRLPRIPRALTEPVLYYGLCVNNLFPQMGDFSIDEIDHMLIRVTSETKGREQDYWQFKYSCEK